MTRDEPMKVLFVNPGGQAQGGAERSLEALISGLADRGHHSLVALMARGDAATSFTNAGATIVGVLADELQVAPRHAGIARFVSGAATAAPTVLRIASDIRQLAALHDVDLIHSNGFRSHLLTPLVRPFGPPVVWSLRDRAPRSFHRTLLRAAAIGATSIVANSGFTAEQMQHRRGALNVVANPVIAGKLTTEQEARAQLGLPRDAHIISVIAHLHPSKGHDLMIDTLLRWDESMRPHLAIAGGHLYGDSRNYEQQLRNQVASAGLSAHVTFLGNVDDVWPVYSASDVVVHPCRHPEGFGRVIVEAQLAGVPVVATAQGGVLDLVTDDETGLLVPSDDVDALHSAVDSLMWDSPRRRRIIARGRLSAEQFGSEAHVDAIVDVYRSALGLPERDADDPAATEDIEASAETSLDRTEVLG